MTDPTLLLVGGASLLLSLILVPVLGRRAESWGLIDHPGGRKTHARAIPTTGGLAIFWAILIPMAAAGVAGPVGEGPLLLSLLWGGATLHLVGLLDDRRELRVAFKFLAQSIAVLPLVALHGMILLPGWLPTWVGVGATFLWFLIIINAFNFLDGHDGLLGGVSIICATGFAALAALGGEWTTLLLLTALIGAIAGFLPFNLPPARVFAGDSGSLVVGFVLAFAAMRITYYDLSLPLGTPPHAVLTPLVILSLPLYDFARVLWMRIRERRNPFAGDTTHLSHRLVRRGFRPRQTLAFVFACTLVTTLGGLLFMRIGTVYAAIVLTQSLVVLAVLTLVEWMSGTVAVDVGDAAPGGEG